MIETPCVIFAGGKSSRMGSNKALLPFAGFDTLTEYQHNRVSKIFKNVYISCRDKNLFNFSANFIEDSNSDTIAAPTFGFIAAFESLQHSEIFVLSVDAPFIDASIIQKLLKEDSSSNDATIAQTPQGNQPLCGIYHRSLLPQFYTMQESKQHRLGQLLKNSKTKFIHFEDEEKFLNLNNPQEYQKALKLYAINSSLL